MEHQVDETKFEYNVLIYMNQFQNNVFFQSEPITTRPVAHDVYSPAIVGSTNINMDTKQHLIHLNNNNKPESPNLAKVSEPSNHLMK